MKTHIKFKFLQIVTSHVADERITIGLFHTDWSGILVSDSMRIATSVDRVPDFIPSKEDIQITLDAIVERAQNLVRQAYPELQGGKLDTGLLHWSDWHSATTDYPNNHFLRLAQNLGLKPVK